jgi:hypothetical protein
MKTISEILKKNTTFKEGETRLRPWTGYTRNGTRCNDAGHGLNTSDVGPGAAKQVTG